MGNYLLLMGTVFLRGPCHSYTADIITYNPAFIILTLFQLWSSAKMILRGSKSAPFCKFISVYKGIIFTEVKYDSLRVSVNGLDGSVT